MTDIKEQLIRLGKQNPELQKNLRPVLDKISAPDFSTTLSLDDLINQYTYRLAAITLEWLVKRTEAVSTGRMTEPHAFLVVFDGGTEVEVSVSYSRSDHALHVFYLVDGNESHDQKYSAASANLEDLRFEVSRDTYQYAGLTY